MSLAEHTRIHLESRGRLTKIGQIVIDSMNKMAAKDAAGELLANHSPASSAFWFAGLAREHAGPGGQFSSDSPFLSATLRERLSDEAITLARDVLACSCDHRWGSWEAGDPWSGEDRDGHAFMCYTCAFDAHAMCAHGCTANQDVLAALDEEISSRGLTRYARPLFDAQVDSDLREAVRHVLRYGRLGKQSGKRLRAALAAGSDVGGERG